jgi:putative nucleotidyltransferase with HDIG domain
VNAFELADQILKSVGDIPPMPHIAAEVMEKLGSDRTTAEDLNRVISQDQALAARVLRMANSSFYAASVKIKTLSHAIGFVGFNSIRSIVIAAATRELYPVLGKNEQLLWEHSIAAGLAARLLARRARFGNPEQAFLAGLLHDIGKTILLLKLRDRMSRVMEKVAKDPSLSFRDLEADEFGFDHAALGQLVGRRWKLGSEIEEAVGSHHTPEEATEEPTLTYVISLANSLCHRACIGPARRPNLDLGSLESARYLNLPAEVLKEAETELVDKFRSEKASILS